jgi:uracil-DNA glycosylase
LKNIFKEVDSNFDSVDYDYSQTNLTRWAKQGVLLLNSVLTVDKFKPGSHSKFGWQNLTDLIIKELSEANNHIVFMLWGKFAKDKKELISGNHLILEAAHPSPLSAWNGFFGCQHFKKCNEFLKENSIKTIKW